GERLLAKEEEEVSAFIERRLRAEGIEILLDTKAVRAARLSDTLKSITVEANGESRDLEAEEILVATGRQPNTGGLNLEAAGVVYDAGRIHTDEYLRTTQPHIYAAGDVTGHFPFTHMAAYEAAVSAMRSFSGRSRKKRIIASCRGRPSPIRKWHARG
ncbi:MAG: FAD-dependent oxidoreductase, partial [Acidobacteria bacterium]|nr:FAD-dependent oxidoreductase [Acidobacteriota bacterium]